MKQIPQNLKLCLIVSFTLEKLTDRIEKNKREMEGVEDVIKAKYEQCVNTLVEAVNNKVIVFAERLRKLETEVIEKFFTTGKVIWRRKKKSF